MSNTGKHAAVTIVSKNYLALAASLAKSFREQHPTHDFIIALVDRADGAVRGSLLGGAELVELAHFSIPDLGRFIYRYSIMELNTAVKPYVIADLFRRRNYDTVIYLDPDIYVFRPLTHVYDALEDTSIVLTPHIRRPFFDGSLPSDLSILQSGTYNLGFIGLKASSSTSKLLNWWMEKLYRDCVVDISKGLFVDQKWIDMVPGFFPDHKILYEPGYNAAYWNLHERPLSRVNGAWFVDGRPLHFFHFSGYSPFTPLQLSRHQNRHQLSLNSELKSLTDFYAGVLLENGYEQTSEFRYAFETLPNGIEVPLQLVNAVMQWASRIRVPTPCPITESDAFCRFLMARGVVPNKPKVVLLFHFLLCLRGDVSAAFPAAPHDSNDVGFREWLKTSGIKEYKLAKLLEFEETEIPHDVVGHIFRSLTEARIPEIERKRRQIWSDRRSFEDFTTWLSAYAPKNLRVSRNHVRRLDTHLPAIGRILNIYFLRSDLQVTFPLLGLESQLDTFIAWLREAQYELQLTNDEISIFGEFARSSRNLLEQMRFLYAHNGVGRRAQVNIFTVDERRAEINSLLSSKEILDFLYQSDVCEPIDHFLDFQRSSGSAGAGNISELIVNGLDGRRNFAFAKRVRSAIVDRHSGTALINLAGYFNAPSGMGESGRSMIRTLRACSSSTREVCLPHPSAVYTTAPTSPYLFGWPMSGAHISITVANADAVDPVRSFLPNSFWATKNVGYWVWETERLPVAFRRSDESFDEIWTPSAYSAKAIAATITTPVRVVPHVLDFEALYRAAPNRKEFGLPENGVLFGFMFDPDSGIQRKNVDGLIRAFTSAFREDDECYLVLKVNGRVDGCFEYEMIKASTDSRNVLFVERRLSRAATYDFLSSLDAYVSLHRSEGFGLTCAEAMALGLPVVASGYSGNLDFMDEDNSLLVKVQPVETDRTYGPYPAGTVWGEPCMDHATASLRELLERERRTELGARAKASVERRLGTGIVGPYVESLIRKLMNPHEAGPSIAHETSEATRASPHAAWHREEQGVSPSVGVG